jgi:signal transduction histidine kinase
MASAPLEPRPVAGRLDRAGRLIAADPELETLQREAGGAMNEPLALPQVAAVAALARKLGTPVSRPALAASADRDIELWVRATPDGDEVMLSLEGWVARAPSAPRLAAILGAAEANTGAVRNEWATDEELRIISLSADLAELLGVDAGDVAGQPLTRILRFDEDEGGDMPLISALAARRAFSGQHARSRVDDSRNVVLDGQIVTGADGSFAGFRGSVRSDDQAGRTHTPAEAFDLALDEVLRSPLDRIIESAERIVARSEGPLRSDYANYGTDIAAAARHLLSVLSSMGHETVQAERMIDLTALAAEAVMMLESAADAANIRIETEGGSALSARGEERAVIQILVNLIGNAIRHSPAGGNIHLAFAATDGMARVTISDEGTGVAAEDRERIFERFERARQKEDGAGLGLAISRRLARSLGGDVTLDSAPGEGARFSLTLPAA